MMRKLAVVVLFLSTLAFAEGTRTWQQSQYSEFEKGTANGIAITSDGSLELAPSFKPISTTPSTYIWAVASDRAGNIYAAAGAPARVYRITPAGASSIIFEPEELQVQALVAAPDGTIYAATSPDGRVYRIVHKTPGKKQDSNADESSAAAEAASGSERDARDRRPAVDSTWKSSVFFDPKTKYIWALALAGDGRLYVGTGDRGEIFRVDRNGTGSVFFKSDEAHIRSLAFDNKGDLIAGSDGSGLVYRISQAGEGFVLYSAPKKEITALAVDSDGNIFAAGVGDKGGASSPPANPAAPGSGPVPTITTPIVIAPLGPGGTNPLSTAPVVSPFPPLTSTGGSEIYRIAPDGSPKKLWNSREDLVYALGFDSNGRLLAGTGNRGHVFAVEDQGAYTDLLKASASQVTAFAPAPKGGLYVATSNLGKVFLLGAKPESEGTYDSDVFDGRIFSRWGRAEVRGHGSFELFARSGNVDNPDRNWSPWSRIDLAKGSELAVPPARFVQWRATMRPSSASTQLDSVTINYLPKNIAPEVEEVFVQVGAKINSSTKSVSDTVSLGGSSAKTSPSSYEPPATATRDRDSIAVRWNAHDDNDDDLVYALYYRGDSERDWKLLKDNIDEKYYSFDSSLLPDGGYTIKVVASDAPSHSPEEALTDTHESARFEVDNTPPQVQSLNAAVEGEALHVTFRAIDGFSPIKRAEFSIDAGDWQYVEPVGQLSDDRVENYDFSAPITGVRSDTEGNGLKTTATTVGREHVIVVRVYDRYDNLGSSKTVVRGGQVRAENRTR